MAKPRRPVQSRAKSGKQISRRPGLDAALAIALEVHKDQVDKGGRPYILHVLRVVTSVPQDECQIVAALHDVVEDGGVSIERLRVLGFGPRVVRAVACLTRRPGERYLDYIGRVRVNPIARNVKLADLADNMNICRLNKFGAAEGQRISKYLAAWHILTAELS